MPQTLHEAIIERVEQAESMYHRLVVVAGPSGAGKTAALREVARRKGVPVVNVNLELSKRMLELTEHQRALDAARIMDRLVQDTSPALALLDNTEILFEPALKQDPMRLLQGLSRNRTVVVTWNGSLENGHLVYAEPGHPEHRKCPMKDFLCVYAGTGGTGLHAPQPEGEA